MSCLNKVISGGQTGADQAGLAAAKQLGIKTGGSIPKGFRTLDGPRPDFEELYDLREHWSEGYPKRTETNVINSHGTVRIATNFYSPGEILTLKFINRVQRPYFDVDGNGIPPVKEFAAWINENNISTLNVAGNSEQTSPGIYDFAFNFLLASFEEAGFKKS